MSQGFNGSTRRSTPRGDRPGTNIVGGVTRGKGTTHSTPVSQRRGPSRDGGGVSEHLRSPGGRRGCPLEATRRGSASRRVADGARADMVRTKRTCRADHDDIGTNSTASSAGECRSDHAATIYRQRPRRSRVTLGDVDYEAVSNDQDRARQSTGGGLGADTVNGRTSVVMPASRTTTTPTCRDDREIAGARRPAARGERTCTNVVGFVAGASDPRRRMGTPGAVMSRSDTDTRSSPDGAPRPVPGGIPPHRRRRLRREGGRRQHRLRGRR